MVDDLQYYDFIFLSFGKHKAKSPPPPPGPPTFNVNCMYSFRGPNIKILVTRLKLLSCIVQSYKGTLQHFHSESDTGRIWGPESNWYSYIENRNSHILWWEKFFAEHGTFTLVQACQLTAHYNNIYTLNRLTLNDPHHSSTSFTNTIRMFRLLITRTNC